MKITLKAMRVNKGLDQKMVAKAMGVTVVTVSLWERLPCTLTVQKAQKLCKFYGYDLGDLDIGAK